MLYKFNHNLGSDDARAINDSLHAGINSKECVSGAIVEIPDSAAEWLNKKYPALMEPAESKPAPKKPVETSK